MKGESEFKSGLIRDLRDMFPGCIVLKNDANYLQGFPDITILYMEHWAVLETKRSSRESYQPNQPYYVNLCDQMSFGAFIYPENREDVLNDLQHAFGFKRSARFS